MQSHDILEEGRRLEGGDTSVVYLFKPKTEINTFPDYGIALLEVECDAIKNKMSELDAHKGDYSEYVIPEVNPEQIKKIIIPEIFKDRISIDSDIEVTWCGIYAEEYGGREEKVPVTEERLRLFASTTPINSTDFNFLGASMKKGTSWICIM